MKPDPSSDEALTRRDAAKAIYRAAIDVRASDAEGDGWWSGVANELADVVVAPFIGSAAAVIDWWHQEWSSVNDSARVAAARIRSAAHRRPVARRSLLVDTRIHEA
ncbi:hypothetical protein [Burkholderia glumae]|uniref:Uncharacterized protein n=1 Tax=Burkholderia glumae TaxID=337 RepID=A0ABY5BBU3_BURGL|nr:hypothetical protein [Burkholderia glumae]USS44475.1 hypothetical protein NFI99_13955 [Burkholderia glumae]UVS88669.1 hypothetical protein EFP17_01930 [Burkholderia glumae]UVT00294.1 hypothetical protein EFP20_00555 [Burkholderia glumae]